MNKQEVIDKLKTAIPDPALDDYQRVEEIALTYALELIEELDEPVRQPELEKPVVPQYVADWYEEHKDNFEYSLQCLCVQGCKPVRQIDTWFDDDSNKPIETLVMMHKFGYEVEKEKLYTVELPNPNAGGHVVLCKTSDGIVSISFVGKARWRGSKNVQLTEAEIKKDFEWAFRWAKEVEE